MKDVTSQITSHLMEAAKLAVEASGNWTGEYAIIVQAEVSADAVIVLTWQRYGPNARDFPREVP